jgi:hypothetical protein
MNMNCGLVTSSLSKDCRLYLNFFRLLYHTLFNSFFVGLGFEIRASHLQSSLFNIFFRMFRDKFNMLSPCVGKHGG